MKGNKKIYIISGVIFAVAIAILLLFLLLPKDNGDPFEPLNCNADDVVMSVGDIKRDFYTLSDEDATVSFNLDNDGIVEIDDDKIIACRAGVVNVEMVVCLDGQSVSEYFKITVLADDYSLQLTPVSNCSIEGNVLSVSANISQFTIDFIDKEGEIVSDVELSISTTNGASCTQLFGVYRLTAESDCVIIFRAEEYDFEVVYTVIV